MKPICHLSSSFTDLGGVERAVQDLTAGLSSLYEVQVLSTKAGTSLSETRGKVSVHHCGSPFSLVNRPIALGLLNKLSNTQAELLHYHLPFPLATWAHLLTDHKSKVKVATWHHGTNRYPLFTRLYSDSLRRFLTDVDAIFVTTPDAIESVESLAGHTSKIHVVPLGVDHRRFQENNEESVAKIKKDYGAPIVLFVGRLVYYKGCEVLIRAMEKLDAKLVIVGEGPLKPQLEQLVKELGLTNRVIFTGRIPEAEMVSLYQAADVFVLPSTYKTECFGLVQVEAMLCGTPVINTSLPGVSWVSQHMHTGLTVPPGDVKALHSALDTILGDDKLRAQLALAAKSRALEHFTLEHHVKLVADIYESLMESR